MLSSFIICSRVIAVPCLWILADNVLEERSIPSTSVVEIEPMQSIEEQFAHDLEALREKEDRGWE